MIDQDKELPEVTVTGEDKRYKKWVAIYGVALAIWFLLTQNK